MAGIKDVSDNRGPEILAVVWTLTGLTTIMVVARIYIRSALLRNLGLDDYLIAIPSVFNLVYCSLTTANVSIGYGKHADTLDQKSLETAILQNTICFVFGILAFSLPKLAVAALLNRLLNPSLAQRIWLWSLTGFAFAVSIVCIILLFVLCDPPKAVWQVHLVTEGAATCKSTWTLVDYTIFTGAISAFVDLYLAIYPSTVLMRLQMSLKKRVALCVVFFLGSVACAMAIIKCFQLKDFLDKDYTYGTAELLIWTNVESNVVIIASCIPTLQPLFEFIIGRRALGSYNNRSDRYKGSNNNFHGSAYSRGKSFKQSRKDDPLATDFESQERILLPDPTLDVELGTSPGVIHRTDHFMVEYELQSSRDG